MAAALTKATSPIRVTGGEFADVIYIFLRQPRSPRVDAMSGRIAIWLQSANPRAGLALTLLCAGYTIFESGVLLLLVAASRVARATPFEGIRTC